MGLFNRKRSTPPSESAQDLFAAEVLDAVLATGRVRSARYDPDAFAIVYEQTGSGTIYLHNTYQETVGVDPAERADRIQRLMSILTSTASDMSWEQARPNLRPVLRGVSFGLSVPGATTVDNPKRLLARPALPYLNELVVIDEPTSMAYVTHVRLEEWGVTPEDVFAAARANLGSGTMQLHPDSPEPEPGAGADPAEARRALIRMIDDGNGYLTSNLLVDGFLAQLARKVGGRPVVFMPDKDGLLLVADDADMLPALYEMVEQEYQEAVRSISPVGYTLDDAGRLVPYQGPAGSDAARAAHRAEVLLASSEYASQKEALDAQFQADDTDIFCASVLVAQRPDQSVFSVAVWGLDVDSLLPEADYVAFQGDGDPVTVPFAVVVAEAALVPEPDYTPARYRVAAWPDASVMARIRAHAVTP